MPSPKYITKELVYGVADRLLKQGVDLSAYSD